jgi:hypothetical protein
MMDMRYPLRASALVLLFALRPSWCGEGSETGQPQRPSPVTLTVTALDRNHRPVADLHCNELKVLDEGKPQPITDCSMLDPKQSTVVIVWDLLNIVKGHRAYSNDLLVRSIRSLKDAGSVYLYLLSNSGALYPVHSLDATETRQFAWPQQIQPALDSAFDKVVRIRPIDFQDDGVRTAATFLKLAEVRDALKKIAGPKTILWLTTGVSNLMRTPYGCRAVKFPGEPDYVAGQCVPTCGKYGSSTTCIDYTPFLQHFAADLQHSGTSLYIVEETPYDQLPRTDSGSPRDTLEQLSLLAGARLFTRGQIGSALNGALTDSLARFQISFAGAADGRDHRLRIVTTRRDVSIEGSKRYLVARPQ